MPSRAESPPGAHVAWLDTFSPWPRDGFALGRMRTLLASLGDPQLAYPAIHVVGTNGKSTAVRTIEALLLAEGVSVGATVSPHVRSWSERITVDGDEVDIEAALARVRPEAEEQQATQFEIVCAAAFAEFAARGVEVAVVEAGLGGRLDATNVLRSHVVLLTNVGLDHTDVLGETRAAIGGEKLAVAQAGSIVVLPDLEFAHLAGPNVRVGGAREAAEALLGRRVEHEVNVALPGRFERRGENEVRDGAHNLDGVRWLVERLPPGTWVVVASILADKDADAMLRELAKLGGRFVATRSSSERALPADALGRLAEAHFPHVDVEPEPAAALARARRLPGRTLVTGSLYLVGDLAGSDG